MSFHRWLHNLRSALAPRRGQPHHRQRGSCRAATHRPNLEVLEDRRLLSFSPATPCTVGGDPTAPWVQNQPVVAADFNNDTVLDLAVGNGGYFNYRVSVLLGTGDGSFQPALNSATGVVPLSLAVGDFDGDDNLDLATANGYDVTVLPGNGDSTLRREAVAVVASGSPPTLQVVIDQVVAVAKRSRGSRRTQAFASLRDVGWPAVRSLKLALLKSRSVPFPAGVARVLAEVGIAQPAGDLAGLMGALTFAERVERDKLVREALVVALAALRVAVERSGGGRFDCRPGQKTRKKGTLLGHPHRVST